MRKRKSDSFLKENMGEIVTILSWIFGIVNNNYLVPICITILYFLFDDGLLERLGE